MIMSLFFFFFFAVQQFKWNSNFNERPHCIAHKTETAFSGLSYVARFLKYQATGNVKSPSIAQPLGVKMTKAIITLKKTTKNGDSRRLEKQFNSWGF